MAETTHDPLAAHIRARLAKSTLDSPAINVSRPGWARILAAIEVSAEAPRPRDGEDDCHPEGTTDPIVEAVRADLLRRSQAGIEKYGTTLGRADIDLAGWVRHAREEALDLALYLTRIAMELEESRPDANSGEVPGSDDGWQPIATAPTDAPYTADMPDEAQGDAIGWAISDDDDRLLFLVWWELEAAGRWTVTKWHPLPASPRSSQKEQGDA